MRPCAIRAQCPADVVTVGVDAETKDQLEHLSFSNDVRLPRLGCDFGAVGLPGWGSSPLSQDYADLDSFNQQTQNEINGHIQPAAMLGVQTPPRPDSVPGVQARVVHLPGFPRQIDPGLAPVGVYCQGDQPAIKSSSGNTCVRTCPDGTLAVITLPPASIQTLNQETSDLIAQQAACAMADVQLICFSPSSGFGATCLLQQFHQDFIFTNPTGQPLTITLDQRPDLPPLPPGVSPLPQGIEFAQTGPSTAVLEGIPEVNGHFDFIITATTATGFSQFKTYSLTVFGVDSILCGKGQIPLGTPNLPDAYISNQYAFKIDMTPGIALWVAGQNVGDYTYSLETGTLPPGITLDPMSGTFSGIPTVEGEFDFSLRIHGGPLSCVQPFSITVRPCNWIDVTNLEWGLTTQQLTGDANVWVALAGETGLFYASGSSAGSANNSYVSSGNATIEDDFINHCPYQQTVHFYVTIAGTVNTVPGSSASGTLILRQNGVIVFSSGGLLNDAFSFDLVFNPGHTTLDWTIVMNCNGTGLMPADINFSGTISITNGAQQSP